MGGATSTTAKPDCCKGSGRSGSRPRPLPSRLGSKELLGEGGRHLRLQRGQGGRVDVPGGSDHLRAEEERRRLVGGRDGGDHRALPWQLCRASRLACQVLPALSRWLLST